MSLKNRGVPAGPSLEVTVGKKRGKYLATAAATMSQVDDVLSNWKSGENCIKMA